MWCCASESESGGQGPGTHFYSGHFFLLGRAAWGTEQSRCSGAAAMGRNFWDPMDIERPNVNVIKFLLCQIGFISACWAGFLWSTGAAELPPPLGNADPATMATAIGGIALTGVITATIVQSTGGSEAPGQEDTSL